MLIELSVAEWDEVVNEDLDVFEAELLKLIN